MFNAVKSLDKAISVGGINNAGVRANEGSRTVPPTLLQFYSIFPKNTHF